MLSFHRIFQSRITFAAAMVAGLLSASASAQNPVMLTGHSTCQSGQCNSGNTSEIFGAVPNWTEDLLGKSDCTTTLGRRVWVGPRWEKRDGNDGGFPLDGDINGVSIGWQSRNVDSLFLRVEGVINDGSFTLVDGGTTNYDEWQIEGLVGYTYGNDCNDLFITPYVGFRYRNAENSFSSPFVGTVDVSQDVWNAPFGVRADYLLSENIAVGIDARMQWKIKDDQNVKFVGSPFELNDESQNQLSYRIEVPVTFRVCEHGEVVLRPYYEWDRFDGDIRSTRINEYGGQISFVLRY